MSAPSSEPEREGPSAESGGADAARVGVVEVVHQQLQGAILAGKWLPGARLPAERELSQSFGVNRITLRAALARLEADGLIVRRHGAATRVCAWRERAGLDMLAAVLGALEPHSAAWHDVVRSFLELRRVLVSEAIALAASRHDQDDLIQLRALADAQQPRLTDTLAFAQGDIEFLRAVVRAARNVGLELVLNTFVRIPQSRPGLLEMLYDDCSQALASYPLVLALIEAGQEDSARPAVRRALEMTDRQWAARQGVELGVPQRAR